MKNKLASSWFGKTKSDFWKHPVFVLFMILLFTLVLSEAFRSWDHKRIEKYDDVMLRLINI